MATKKAEDVKITDTKEETKKTPKEKLIDEAKALKIKFQEDVTTKQLKALIATEKLKADLPEPPPPPPAISIAKLSNKDIIVKVAGIGKTGQARLLQGLMDINGENKWKDLSVIAPTGAPRIVLRAKVDETTLKLTQKVKAVRLLLGGESGTILETKKF